MRLPSLSKLLIVVLAISWSAAGTAFAEEPGPMPPQAPPPGQVPMGLELTAVDAAARKIEGIQHCVEPAKAGQRAAFAVAPHVDMSFMAIGKSVGVMVDTNTDPDTVVGAVDKDCRTMMPPADGQQVPPQGGQQQAPPQDGQQGPPQDGQQPGGHSPEGDAPVFERGFLNRVWKFAAETDSFEDGKLSITVEKILNLPKKFRQQDDEVIDQDALVLVGKSVRVYQDGKRVDQSKLDDSEHVRVQGKMLPPAKWQEDEDGTAVTTIRAKKLFIVD